ncbi:hypothetical protein THS5294_01505 [Thalassobacter stenotrophicus]|uniref:Uncharacterized protein n=2 Tax=Thalassobacter stenotrophicus TaxID=266809 RepID=A0A0P1EYR3_9RHOB|nr:hypothetical protein THS5294_01505 [Thalassobacter stenotrophicus]SHI70452.1 hypothetical protein SAMN02744035_01297 [Thalassobacter stenotrophicus DSM 16310]
MAYKVGSTIVISDSGTIDWSRISGKPAIGAGDITSVSVSNGNSGSGVRIPQHYNSNCNCTPNCYVESLSGGGTSGAVTVSTVRKYFNCNCNCRC